MSQIVENVAETDAAPAPFTRADGGALLRLLVRKLCDLVVLPARHLTAHERTLAADILIHALDQCEEQTRREAAERLAPISDAPGALLRRLALDTPFVAAPVIETCPHLPSWIFAEIVLEAI